MIIATIPFWEIEHLGALLGSLLLIISVLSFGKRSERMLIFLLFASFPLSFLANWLSLDQLNWVEILPFHVCDLLAYVAGWALWKKKSWARQMTYFLGIGASLQALLTPNLEVGFPHILYFVFFLNHAVLVAAALYLPIVEKMPSTWRGVVQTYLLGLCYFILTIPLNFWLGTNFAFSASPPPGGSLLDLLGPWPWYLISLQPISFFVLVLLKYLNFNKMKECENRG